MKNAKSAGMSGKGFYVALSLCIAMVGAACWYAYSRTAQPQTVPDGNVSSISDTTLPSTSTRVTTTTTRANVMTTRTTPVTEDVLAIIPSRTTTQTTATTAIATTTAPAELPVYPVSGEVLQQFSHGELVKSATTGIWQTHNGVDFSAAVGDEVIAVADGTVTAVERDPLWGVCVTILHNDGVTSRYCGLNEGLTVSAGEILERGTVIGAVGDTNESEGAMDSHLHFEMRRNDSYIDPIAYLQGA